MGISLLLFIRRNKRFSEMRYVSIFTKKRMVKVIFGE